MAQQKGFKNLKFARLHSLQNAGAEPESLTEEVYLQQAAIFRENLQSGVPTISSIAEHLAKDEDARATYNGYTSILADDLANTDKANEEEEEVTAKKMIARGRVRLNLPPPLTHCYFTPNSNIPSGLCCRNPGDIP